MTNPSSSLAHGESRLTRSYVGHDLNPHANAAVRRVRRQAVSGFPAREPAGRIAARSGKPRALPHAFPGQTRPGTAQTRVISTPRDRGSIPIGKLSLRTGGAGTSPACGGVTGIRGNHPRPSRRAGRGSCCRRARGGQGGLPSPPEHYSGTLTVPKALNI